MGIEKEVVRDAFRRGMRGNLGYALTAEHVPCLDRHVGEVVTQESMDGALHRLVYRMFHSYSGRVKPFPEQLDEHGDINEESLKSMVFQHGQSFAQTLSGVALHELYARYGTGQTFATYIPGGEIPEASIHVDDIRGFMEIVEDGVYQTVSESHPLIVHEYPTTSKGISQSFEVIGTLPDHESVSLFPSLRGSDCTDGMSGYLLVRGMKHMPVPGDAIIAENAPIVLRPWGKIATNELGRSDLLTLGLVEDAVKFLMNAGVSPAIDGRYLCMLDATGFRELKGDNRFFQSFTNSVRASDIAERAFIIGDVLFVVDRDKYVQRRGLLVGVNGVHRALVMGEGAVSFGDVCPLREPREEISVGYDETIEVEHGAFIGIRGGHTTNGASVTWCWEGSVSCPITLENGVTPTSYYGPGSVKPLYDHAVVIEFAG